MLTLVMVICRSRIVDLIWWDRRGLKITGVNILLDKKTPQLDVARPIYMHIFPFLPFPSPSQSYSRLLTEMMRCARTVITYTGLCRW